ncbi:MAG: hypothetical protein AAF974_11185 [Cyanobacteria bacterium P01_E01_bin.34]
MTVELVAQAPAKLSIHRTTIVAVRQRLFPFAEIQDSISSPPSHNWNWQTESLSGGFE